MAIFRSFGENPSPDRLPVLQKSANYKEKGFENFSPTELMIGSGKMLKNTIKFFSKPRNTTPQKTLPSVITDLKQINSDKPVVVWFGHSSYLIRINGKNILVDPVFSGHASPFVFGVKSFAGSNAYNAESMPAIDVLIITHDHYDHLDYQTVLALKPKIGRIVTSLGVGSHLRYWGIDDDIITEMDWWDQLDIGAGIELIAAPARHFSGRSFKRNQTLWSSFVLRTADCRIYIGADSGYDTHFKTIGERFGPFDLAILETGQYNPDWALIHMSPEQAVQAAIDLGAKTLLPVHWGKFSLAFHAWYEPPERVLARARELQQAVTTPMMGEVVVVGGEYPEKEWWVEYK